MRTQITRLDIERAEADSRIAELECQLAEALELMEGYRTYGLLMQKKETTLLGQLAAARETFTAYLDALEFCHQCGGQLAMDDIEPSHCENCSGDCDSHEEPNCTPIYVLHDRARKALAQLDAAGKER